MAVAALALPSPLAIALRPVTTDRDRAYVLDKWCEDYKHTPENRKLSWSLYKRHVLPHLRGVLDRIDTHILGAYVGESLVGWIAYAPGRRVGTVHWVRVRTAVGREPNVEPMRLRGVMASLFDAVHLGSRCVYTHRGPRGRQGGETSDAWIAKWLARRGTAAAFMPYAEWAS